MYFILISTTVLQIFTSFDIDICFGNILVFDNATITINYYYFISFNTRHFTRTINNVSTGMKNEYRYKTIIL